MAERVIVVDLDGTLYRGDGPLRVYAEALALSLPTEGGTAFLADVDRYLAGAGDAELAASSDGWVAVRKAADRYGVPDEAIGPAFLSSRHALGDGTCTVEAPDGLVATLRSLRPSVLLVLATNSPADGLDALLERLDAARLFDRIVVNARKPDGLRDLLAELVPTVASPTRVLSIGDHWTNDIAPALDAGAVGFHVDPSGRAEGPADARAATVEELLPALTRWAKGDCDT